MQNQLLGLSRFTGLEMSCCDNKTVFLERHASLHTRSQEHAYNSYVYFRNTIVSALRVGTAHARDNRRMCILQESQTGADLYSAKSRSVTSQSYAK